MESIGSASISSQSNDINNTKTTTMLFDMRVDPRIISIPFSIAFVVLTGMQYKHPLFPNANTQMGPAYALYSLAIFFAGCSLFLSLLTLLFHKRLSKIITTYSTPFPILKPFSFKFFGQVRMVVYLLNGLFGIVGIVLYMKHFHDICVGHKALSTSIGYIPIELLFQFIPVVIFTITHFAQLHQEYLSLEEYQRFYGSSDFAYATVPLTHADDHQDDDNENNINNVSTTTTTTDSTTTRINMESISSDAHTDLIDRAHNNKLHWKTDARFISQAGGCVVLTLWLLTALILWVEFAMKPTLLFILSTTLCIGPTTIYFFFYRNDMTELIKKYQPVNTGTYQLVIPHRKQWVNLINLWLPIVQGSIFFGNFLLSSAFAGQNFNALRSHHMSFARLLIALLTILLVPGFLFTFYYFIKAAHYNYFIFNEYYRYYQWKNTPDNYTPQNINQVDDNVEYFEHEGSTV